MAEFIVNYSGEEINEGIRRALLFNPDAIGCQELTSSASNPTDLNTQIDPGYFKTQFFTHGPAGLETFSPLLFLVSVTKNVSGSVTSVSQSIALAQMTATRSSTNGGTDWTEWQSDVAPSFLVSSGTVVADHCAVYEINDSTVAVADKAQIVMKLHAANAANAKVKVNNSAEYAILTPDGTPIAKDNYVAGSYLIMYFSGDSSTGKFYLTGAASIPQETQDTIDNIASTINLAVLTKNRILATDSSTPMKFRIVDVSPEQLEKLNQLGASKVVVTDGSGKLVASSNITLAQLNALGALTKATDVNSLPILAVTVGGNTTALTVNSSHILPLTNLTASKGVVTDANGKLTSSTASAAQVNGLANAEASKAIVVDENGILKASPTTSAQIDALSEVAKNALKVMIVNANGTAGTSLVTSAQLLNLTIADSLATSGSGVTVFPDDLP